MTGERKSLCMSCRKDLAEHAVHFADREILLCCECAEDLLNQVFKEIPAEKIYRVDTLTLIAS